MREIIWAVVATIVIGIIAACPYAFATIMTYLAHAIANA